VRIRRAVYGSAAALAAAALATSGCASTAAGSSTSSRDSAFSVLVVLPLSGAGAAQGNAELQGAKAAARVLNSHGGILGHKVVLTVDNDQANPSTAITQIQGAISGSSKPDLVIAGASSNETDAVAPILNRAQVLNIESDSDPKIDSGTKTPYTFDSTVSIPSVINALVTYVRSQHASKVGFVYANDALGSAVGQYEVGALKQAGLKVVSASYSATAIDDSSTLLKIKSQNPGVLVVEGFGPQAGYLFSSRAKIGWNIPTIGDSAVASSGLASLVPAADLKNVRIQAFADELYRPFSQQSPAMQTFIKAVAATGPISQPISEDGFVYDALMLADQAAVQAHSISASAIKGALEHLRKASDSRIVSFSDPTYSPASHVIDSPPSDYAFVRASGITSGFFDVPAGTAASSITG